jgi:hypothetical protein
MRTRIPSAKALGIRTDYPKIEIFVDGVYKATTTWAPTLRKAKESFVEQFNLKPSQVQVSYLFRKTPKRRRRG